MSADDPDVVMLGSGGHARSLQEALESAGTVLAGYIGPEGVPALVDVPRLGADDVLERLDPARVRLVNGIGMVRNAEPRARLRARAVELGFAFRTVVDPTATVRPSVHLGSGVQVLAHAVVNSDVVLHDGCIVNTGAIIEHHSVVGTDSHVAPGAILAGGVTVGARTLVGLGARVVEGISVGSDCIIGSGAVVVRDVAPGHVAVGVPAVAAPRR